MQSTQTYQDQQNDIETQGHYGISWQLGGIHSGISAPKNFEDLDNLDLTASYENDLSKELAIFQSGQNKGKLESKELSQKLEKQKNTMEQGLVKMLAIGETIKAEKKEKEYAVDKFATENKLRILREKSKINKTKSQLTPKPTSKPELKSDSKIEPKNAQNLENNKDTQKDSQPTKIPTKKGYISFHPLKPIYSNQDSPPNSINDSSLSLLDYTSAKPTTTNVEELNLNQKNLKSQKTDPQPIQASLSTTPKPKISNNSNNQTIQAGQKPSIMATKKIAAGKTKQADNTDKSLVKNNSGNISPQPKEINQSTQFLSANTLQKNPDQIPSQIRLENRLENSANQTEKTNINENIKIEDNLETRIENEVKFFEQKIGQSSPQYLSNNNYQIPFHTPFGSPQSLFRADKTQLNKLGNEAGEFENPISKLAKLKEAVATKNGLKDQLAGTLHSEIKQEIQLLRKVVELAGSIESLAGIKVVEAMEKMVLDVLAVGNQPVNLAVLNEYGKLIEKSLLNWQKELAEVVKSYGKVSGKNSLQNNQGQNQEEGNLNSHQNSQYSGLNNNLNNNLHSEKYPNLAKVKEQFWQKWQDNFLGNVLYPVISLLLLAELFEDHLEGAGKSTVTNFGGGENMLYQQDGWNGEIDWLVGLHTISQNNNNQNSGHNSGHNSEQFGGQNPENISGSNVNGAITNTKNFGLEKQIMSEILESVRGFLKVVLKQMNAGWMLFGETKLEHYPIEQHHLLKNSYNNYNLGSEAFAKIYKTAIENFSYELFMTKMGDNFELMDHGGLKFAMKRGLKGVFARLEKRTLTYLRGCL